MSDATQDGFRLRFSWRWLVMLALTATILYLLATRLTDADKVGAAIDNADPAVASIAVAVLLVNFGLVASRWTVIVRAMGKPLGVGRALSVILATRPLDVLLPSRGSDFLRFLGIRDVMGAVEASGSVLAQRLVDVQSLCVMGLIGGLMSGNGIWVAAFVVALVALWSAVALITTRLDDMTRLPVLDRFADKLRALLLAFTALKTHPAHLAVAIALSLASWSAAISIVWVLSIAVDAPLALTDIVAFWPLAIFVGMLPLSLAGMGTRDAAFIALLAAYAAVDATDGRLIVVTMGYSLVANILPSIIGLPFMLRLLARTQGRAT